MSAIPLRPISRDFGSSSSGKAVGAPRTLRRDVREGISPSGEPPWSENHADPDLDDELEDSQNVRASLLPHPRSIDLSQRPSPAEISRPNPPPPFGTPFGVGQIPIPPFFADNSGLMLVGLSQLFFAFMNITVKYFLSVSHISTLTLIAVRMFITGLLCVLYLSFIRDANPWLGPPALRKLLVARGFFGFAGLFSNYQSYRGLSVSDSLTIQFLAPSGTALLGYLWLGERLSWREVAGGGFALVGVLLVSRPPFLFGGSGGAPAEDEDITERADRAVHLVARMVGGLVARQEDEGWDGEDEGRISRMAGAGWALTCVFTASIAYITIRAIGTRAHALHSMAYFSYFCVLSSVVVLLFSPGPFVFVESWKDFGLIILIGIFGFVAQMLLTLGLQRENAGRASMAMYLGLFYSLILEFIIFHTIPPFLSVLGAGIIILSAVWVAINKPPTPPPNALPPQVSDEESVTYSAPPTPISPTSPPRSPAPIPPGSNLRHTQSPEHYPQELEEGDEAVDALRAFVSPPTRGASVESRENTLRVAQHGQHGLGRRRSSNTLRAED